MTRKLSRIALAATAAAALGLTGCMDFDTVLKVKKDGSGTITQTIVFGPAAAQMMALQALSAQPGEPGGQNLMVSNMIVQLRGAASGLGEGVKCESAEALTDPGKTGVKAVYSFADIGKLRLSEQPDMGPMSVGGQAAPGAASAPRLTFKLVPSGDTAKLVIAMPQPPPKPADVSTNQPATETPQVSPQEQEMMKTMFADMCIRMRVQVAGEIKKTNASYVETDPVTQKKDTVILLDMNIGRIISNPEHFKKLTDLGPDPDLERAKQALKDIPGLKIETVQNIEISFQ